MGEQGIYTYGPFLCDPAYEQPCKESSKIPPFKYKFTYSMIVFLAAPVDLWTMYAL